MREKIKLIVIDVDGTMTDGSIYYDSNGNEMKKFCTRDAAGFFVAQNLGIDIMVLTGRESLATVKRMRDLNVHLLFQGVTNKKDFLLKYMKENNLLKKDVAYIGDDLNDLPPMSLVGYIGCPKDSCKEIKKIADYVSLVNGGNGAVRDVIEHIIDRYGDWNNAINNVYSIGI